MKRARLLLLAVLLLPRPAAAEGPARSGKAWCGTSATATRDALLAHREERARHPELRAARTVASFDVGDIAVLLDEGDLALHQNALDLQGKGLRFTPTGAGYTVSRVDLPLLPDQGTALPLGDDATVAQPLRFSFPFYGRSYSELHVNSDGNLTFEEGDGASSARTVTRLVAGAPRIAPLLADLDPSSRGGRVSAESQADRLIVTWTAVPQFGQADANTFQAALSADGTIDFAYAAQLSASVSEGAVGIAPGHDAGGLTTTDFASAAAVATGPGAIAESFRDEEGLDTVAVARRFLATHPDEYEQLVVFTDRRTTPAGTFAYEQTVRNDIAGLGDEVFDFGSEYGSGGALQSVVLMDAISKYPEPFTQRFLDEDSTLTVLAHESGHRWLAHALFRDGGRNSSELLGRDQVHWSFFMDSDASHLEGNDIEDLGGGRFRTLAAALRYSPLDQYLMGLRPASEVPPFFVVRSPVGAGSDPGRTPRSGLAFSGTRKDVTIADVQAAIGPRSPAFPAAAASFRQAWVFVSTTGTVASADLEKIDRLRQAWPDFHAASVEGRGTVLTHLR